ncbi:hypothetical protein BN2476_630005 [Paraburkholderia piptadeniae]|uniref:Uncharacterized protein n=1 Tax=Paraburkholderia piptadeniae TaxID=1701573 RepID=A0A1N7SL15_9BURK|nr:hypothetical protein BN2476_630005 [Paraburkholderia piptadeniae]
MRGRAVLSPAHRAAGAQPLDSLSVHSLRVAQSMSCRGQRGRVDISTVRSSVSYQRQFRLI